MNTIEMIERVVAIHMERANSPRFLDYQLIGSINLAINDFFRDRIGNIKDNKAYSDESNETVVEELRTLIKEQVNNAMSSNTINYPNDFIRLKNLSISVNNIQARCKYLSDEQIEDTLRDSYLKPKVHKTRPVYYWTQGATSMKVYHGSTFTPQNYTLKYYAKPKQVSIGLENNKINETGNLSIGVQYVCYTEVNLNVGSTNTIYPAGQVFTATGTNIISGIVLPFGVIVSCDLPEETHNEICKMAADNLLIAISELDKEQFMNKNINQD